MPNIETFLPHGYDDQKKVALINGLTRATVESVGAPLSSVRVWISEVGARDFGLGGEICTRAEAGIIVQAFLIAGRSDAQKATLIRAMTDAAVTTLSISRDNVRVIIRDIFNGDFGIGGDTAAVLGRGIGRPSDNNKA
ncbi:4-oxalocrotonate tautomerase [Betaproteobacteria bacterium]|nr:4-oxalocrotonate tautomerase [Betaproteobacteria bacterium]GHU06651.1 4-oxalocrotonate tautomerase [Betaproteobacteria bacterium]GHU20903.1 4-oxalocrotonate tautomerase [Betaproteobacteria bacterium]